MTTALATAAPTVAELVDRAAAIAAERTAERTRVERARADRPCADCGATPARRYLTGPLCASCAPPQPPGYCLARCYCPGDSCTRPADLGASQLVMVLVMAAVGVLASLLALVLWRLVIRWLVGV